jgi:hypothetical protein
VAFRRGVYLLSLVMRTLGIICLFAILFTSAFAQKQGINGQVFWLSGNQMPGPDKKSTPEQGIVREIHIYKITTMNDVVVENNYYHDVKTELVAKVTSGRDGYFKVRLLPGEYSVFTVEPKGLFANMFDLKQRINPVIVKPRKFTWVTITIDYEAAY